MKKSKKLRQKNLVVKAPQSSLELHRHFSLLQILSYPGVVLVLCLLVSWSTYYYTLDYPFLFDDLNYIYSNASIQNVIPSLFEGGIQSFVFPNRKIVEFTFALNYALHGLNVSGYHVINISFHAFNAFLVFYLIKLLFLSLPSRNPSSEMNKKKELGISYVVTGLFIAHPLAVNSVTYITQRYVIFATFFYLLGFLSFLKLRSTSFPRSLYWLLGGGLAYWGAMHSKEIALTLPLVCMAHGMIWASPSPDQFRRWRKRTLFGSAILFIVAVGVAYQKGLFSSDFGITGFRSTTLWSPWVHFLTELRVFVHYWKLLWIPFSGWMSVDHVFPISQGILEWAVWAAIFFHLTVIGGAIMGIRKGYFLIGFGVFWFYLSIGPVYLILPNQEVMVEYKTYLGSIGFFLILAELLLVIDRRWRMKIPLLLGIILFVVYEVGTFQRNHVFQSEMAFWTEVIQKSPSNSRAFFNRGVILVNKGQIQAGIHEYDKSIELWPEYLHAHFNRANAYLKLKQYKPAIENYDRLLQLDPEHQDALLNRGYSYYSLRDYDKAIDDYNQLIQLNPKDSRVYLNRGNVYAQQKQYKKAIDDFRHALQLDSKNHFARSNLKKIQKHLANTLQK